MLSISESGHVDIIPYRFSRRFIILYGTMWTDIFCRNDEYDMKAWNERTNTPAALLYRGRAIRRSHPRCSIKKLFLKISQYPQEAPLLESLLKKVAALNTGVSLWILQNCKDYLFRKTSANAPFWMFWFMVHFYMGLKVQDLNCLMASGFRVAVTGLVFSFWFDISLPEPIPDLCSKI